MSNSLSIVPQLVLQPAIDVSPAGVNTSRHDMGLFHLFRTQTASQLTGGVDQIFWNMDLLQAIRIYPALWHASLAMAAMHKTLRNAASDHASQEDDVLALKHHYLSIKHMLDAAAMQGMELPYSKKEMILMTTILLATISSLRGDMREAIIHARSGLRLYYQWNFRQYKTQQLTAASKIGALSSDSLIMLMEFLEYQFALFTGTTERPPGIPDFASATLGSDSPFTSLTEAYVKLLPLVNGAVSLWADSQVPDLAQQTYPLPDRCLVHRHALRQWRSRFQNLKRLSKNKTSEMDTVMRLELYCRALEVTLHADSSEPGFSVNIADFNLVRMLALVEKLFANQTELANDTTSTNIPIFSFSLSIYGPLAAIAVFCRKRIVRQRMLFLLRHWPRVESIWHGTLLIRMCESIYQVENEGAMFDQQSCHEPHCIDGEYVCLHHRILASHSTLGPDGEMQLKLTSVGDSQRRLPERTFMLTGTSETLN